VGVIGNSGSASPLLVIGIVLYFALKPIYLWGSGLPQLADLVLAATMLHTIVLARGQLQVGDHLHAVARIAVLFALYVTVVNLAAMILVDADVRFALSAIFQVYNTVALLWIIAVSRLGNVAYFRAVAIGSMVGICSQVVVVGMTSGLGAGRASGTFNNPNQLGYYGVLSAAIFVALVGMRVFGSRVLVAGVALATLVVVASLSKAALGALAIILAGLATVGAPGLREHQSRIRTIFFILAVTTVVVITQSTRLGELPLVRSVFDRLAANESDSSLEARGYNRIIDYPEYWLFGAGEGDYSRFGSDIEFHSTLGNVQVSYGFVGILILLALLISVVRRSGLPGVYLVIAPLVYGLTHNGMRNSLFWILFGLLAAVAYMERSSASQATRESRSVAVPVVKQQRRAGPSESEDSENEVKP
jgi:hypothetical protein